MPVMCRNSQRQVELDIRWLRRLAQKLLDRVDRPEATLSLWLTDDHQMALLHERWMGEPGSTDVLSFSQAGGPSNLLGDVAISVETTARRSPKDVQGEVVRCLIHGLLHLTGHDHVRMGERQRMSQEARRLRRFIRCSS